MTRAPITLLLSIFASLGVLLTLGAAPGSAQTAPGVPPSDASAAASDNEQRSAIENAALDPEGVRTALQITRVTIRNISPEPPIPGQLAQIEFAVTGGLDDVGFEEMRVLIADSIRLEVDGQRIPVDATSVESPSVGDDGLATYGGAMTFRWPNFPSGTSSETITQSVVVRISNSRVIARPRLVRVSVPTTDWLMTALTFLALILTAMAIASLYFRFLREPIISRLRGRSLTDAREARPYLEAGEPPLQTLQASVAQPIHGDPQTPAPLPPPALVRAVAEGQAVLVLGPGASAQAGVPTAVELLLQLIEGMGGAAPRGFHRVFSAADPAVELSQLMERLGGFSKVMDALAARGLRAELVNQIAAAVDGFEASELHKSFAQCPWRAVVSLTWDRLAERAFVRGSDDDLRVVTVQDAVELPSASRAGERLLFKPYGDFDRPATVVLTMDEMRRQLARAPDFQRVLAGMLQSQTFLFVGVDIDTIEQFLHATSPELEIASLRHWVLVPRDPTNEIREVTLARFGIQMLAYEPDSGPAAMTEFAMALRTDVRSSSVIPRSDAVRLDLASDRVMHLRLESIGPFRELELDFAAAAEGAPWTVIFGGNGVGKSTILRAIALVLAGDHPAAIASGRRLLRHGSLTGMIELKVGAQLLKTRLIRDRSSVVVTSLQQTPVGAGNALAMGFPALRGARAPDPGGVSPRVEPRDPDPIDLVALIAGAVDDRVADFKQWLVNTLSQASQGLPRAVAMRDLLGRIICEMVPGEITSFAPLGDDFVIRVETAEGQIPLDDLSQGMASIFNWVGLLVQRLFSISDASPKPNEQPAIVLIDEIDAHLHPDWQRRLVELTQRYFPRVQIIATSHSPLLAGALRGEQMLVLQRNPETKEVESMSQSIDLYGLRAHDILTSAVFGLSSDRNPEVEQLRKEYVGLRGHHDPDGAHSDRLTELEERLRAYKVNVPREPMERAKLPRRMSKKLAKAVSAELVILDEVARPSQPPPIVED